MEDHLSERSEESERSDRSSRRSRMAYREDPMEGEGLTSPLEEEEVSGTLAAVFSRQVQQRLDVNASLPTGRDPPKVFIDPPRKKGTAKGKGQSQKARALAGGREIQQLSVQDVEEIEAANRPVTRSRGVTTSFSSSSGFVTQSKGPSTSNSEVTRYETAGASSKSSARKRKKRGAMTPERVKRAMVDDDAMVEEEVEARDHEEKYTIPDFITSAQWSDDPDKNIEMLRGFETDMMTWASEMAESSDIPFIEIYNNGMEKLVTQIAPLRKWTDDLALEFTQQRSGRKKLQGDVVVRRSDSTRTNVAAVDHSSGSVGSRPPSVGGSVRDMMHPYPADSRDTSAFSRPSARTATAGSQIFSPTMSLAELGEESVIHRPSEATTIVQAPEALETTDSTVVMKWVRQYENYVRSKGAVPRGHHWGYISEGIRNILANRISNDRHLGIYRGVDSWTSDVLIQRIRQEFQDNRMRFDTWIRNERIPDLEDKANLTKWSERLNRQVMESSHGESADEMRKLVMDRLELGRGFNASIAEEMRRNTASLRRDGKPQDPREIVSEIMDFAKAFYISFERVDRIRRKEPARGDMGSSNPSNRRDHPVASEKTGGYHSKPAVPSHVIPASSSSKDSSGSGATTYAKPLCQGCGTVGHTREQCRTHGHPDFNQGPLPFAETPAGKFYYQTLKLSRIPAEMRAANLPYTKWSEVSRMKPKPTKR